MYEKVSTSLNFVDREKEVLEFWKKNNIFEKSIESREGGPTYTFYDGPPTANGMPHIGHILTRVIKDIIPRYRTMKGYKVLRKAGWDTHGLPVELEVEKQLGINGKSQIENYGVEPFIKQCKQSVWKYKNEWEKMSDRVGYWADMENPYVTYDNNYIESEWWALKKIWEQGLLYKGHKIVPYCPRCGTALSSHEVAQGYKDVKETSIYVKFRVKGEEQVYLMAWTTTPWTLPSNVALTVNPDETYVKAKCSDEVYILAEALAETVLKEEFEVLERVQGKDLIGMEYEPLFDFVVPDKKAYYVVGGDFVTLTDGTGIVHTAPAFGEDDARVGRAYDLPFVQLVNEQGRFVDAVKPWKGVFVKDADREIISHLDQRNLLYKAMDYEHSYPFCWRCDTPLLYYARDTWFIKMTEVKDRLIKNNRTVNWLPENIKEGRFGNFLENVVDWGLSRERYWGTPLPIWECECGHRHVVGSIAELKEMGENVPEDIELHKPYIDNVYLKCPKCKTGRMKRVTEVIDCWFDSGSMPFAQWHYPFENEDLFKDNFPADFISEAIDQTRGWFYSLMAISTLLFDQSPFKNCIVMGHVNDKDGQKMSKHKGNVVDPWTVLDKQGADAVRWYFYTESAPWLPSRFYEEAVSEAQRKFMGTLWNTYAFYVLYANIDQFDPTKYELDFEKLSVMDKWILSRLHTLIGIVDKNLENYRITESARAIEDFVDELSNWYVRRSRERFWQKEMNQDKINAYMTLNTVLVTVAKLSAPFVPFMAEAMYRNLVKTVDPNAPESVHMCDFPVVDETFVDAELEKNMELVLKIVVEGRACRNTANIKNRQPLGKMFVKSEFELPETFRELVMDELNVKELIFTNDAKHFTTYKFKPQLRTLGPRYGKLVPKIAQVLAGLDGNEAMDILDKGEKLTFEVDGTAIELAKDDVLIETAQKEGYVSETDRDVTVILDTNLTPELVEEGFVREIISKVQTMRKEAGFEVMDHIKLYYNGNEKIAEIMRNNMATICDEVLADSAEEGSAEGYGKEWNINGEKVFMVVVKV
ncbi:isoleucine--tRNA ligase [Clostridium thermosuccinogenes]|uniref:Isoleucine--tRNA ligase n=1 Tax=Clostridium thermosuccinogenes TaxID=84032 RepID=A0A2K2FJ14_9CLOT|nr:isoleucine--tRNA ligase [Pseudoclostridium thermosuccinogenes]AUS96188.1 isoleucine--tRNA ligase [Pseudoclostridium thermosuccinogenes]PNT98768.1 isoleucine--tRNA ligase [Pseudoclostridium thermosuccinogenes]PNU00767.1 isoleucine--tRNA ligase [Pseudoclostridium thermosuccinogenes]